jgi:hypothetical protein
MSFLFQTKSDFADFERQSSINPTHFPIFVLGPEIEALAFSLIALSLNNITHLKLVSHGFLPSLIFLDRIRSLAKLRFLVLDINPPRTPYTNHNFHVLTYILSEFPFLRTLHISQGFLASLTEYDKEFLDTLEVNRNILELGIIGKSNNSSLNIVSVLVKKCVNLKEILFMDMKQGSRDLKEFFNALSDNGKKLRYVTFGCDEIPVFKVPFVHSCVLKTNFFAHNLPFLKANRFTHLTVITQESITRRFIFVVISRLKLQTFTVIRLCPFEEVEMVEVHKTFRYSDNSKKYSMRKTKDMKWLSEMCRIPSVAYLDF